MNTEVIASKVSVIFGR